LGSLLQRNRQHIFVGFDVGVVGLCHRQQPLDDLRVSSGLTIWDWLHGTLRLDVPQDAITVGVPAYLDPAEVTLPKVLAMPFEPQRDPWRLAEGARRRAPRRPKRHRR
jgi:hypothetical protein